MHPKALLLKPLHHWLVKPLKALIHWSYEKNLLDLGLI